MRGIPIVWLEEVEIRPKGYEARFSGKPWEESIVVINPKMLSKVALRLEP